MDPPGSVRGACRCGLPRTRGDGPGRSRLQGVLRSASPHTRGWTPNRHRRPDTRPGFPAHAGMDPCRARVDPDSRRLPRTRGDGPRWWGLMGLVDEASPHTRGWTRVFPRTNGVHSGFPAHAGMDLSWRCRPVRRSWLPRTRGDGPHPTGQSESNRTASPHTRGWTGVRDERDDGRRGFPAHAGMDPGSRARPARYRGLPRTRGDGPPPSALRRPGQQASPHTRGWTHEGQRIGVSGLGFPAHAGMDRWLGA